MKKIFLLILSSIILPLTYAQQSPLLSQNSVTSKSSLWAKFDPQTEKKQKRSEFAKHFANPDGTTTAIISTKTSIHYLDEDSLWQDINTDITPNTTAHFNKYD